jgi:hypothetical protein
MSDFILEYDILESIANCSKSLAKRSEEYGDSLEGKIVSGIGSVTGPSTDYLLSANDSVKDKINELKQKSEIFNQFADQISNLLEVARQIDQEVADIIASQREDFLNHHESLRIADWKAKLLGLIVDIKNSIPLLGTIADVLEGLAAIFETLEDSIKHWYECEGGKYIVKAIGSVVVAAIAVALFVVAFPVSGFFAVCGAIGAGIAAINAITDVATSVRAVDAAVEGDPAWARIYGKQDKLSDVLRQTNFGSGFWNDISGTGAKALDITETFCDIVGFAEIGKGALKLLKGDAFKLLKDKGALNFSDLKNGLKNGIVDLKSNIQKGYADLKKGNSASNLYEEFHKIKTPEAKYDYLLDKAKTMDVSTKNNGAIFYSGRVVRADGSVLKARDMAESYADNLFKDKGIVKLTLERTPGGKWMDDLGLFNETSGGKLVYEELGLSKAQVDGLWDTLSGRFADGASGAVTAFSKNVPKHLRTGPKATIFWKTELDRLRKNKEVKHINIR